MPAITFLPSGRLLEVPSGTQLLDAMGKAGIEIDLSCGGEGTCGDCIVRVKTGDVDSSSQGMLSGSALSDGHVLACRTRVLDKDVVIEIPQQSGKDGGQFIDETDSVLLIRQDLFPREWQHDPLTLKWLVQVPPPRLEDGLSDLERLTRMVQKDWGKREFHYALPVIQKLAGVLREHEGLVTITLVRSLLLYHIVDVEPGDQTTRHYGIAIDVGTTTVAVQLVSLPLAKVVGTRTAYNDQVVCGLDVISRINYAQKPERLKELSVRVLKTINTLVTEVCRAYDVDPGEISNAVIAGNTTMTHLLLGLNPEYLRLAPYTPTLLEAQYFTSREIGLEINPNSWVYISPAVGSYVGGDITSGLLCTDIATDSDAVNLFIDIGTNGEMAVGNSEFLLTCACSAGPAFEGGGIEFGMRASLGAIEKVQVAPETGASSYQTIGNVLPVGICGSGMISLLAGLSMTGWIDSAGKLDRVRSSPVIRVVGRQAIYIIATAEQSGIGKAIVISETDIENILRAKAAIFSAVAMMLEETGLDPSDLAQVYIAGGFGRFLDIEKAVCIGLLPDLPREKYFYIGNSSLTGAFMVLVSQEFREKQRQLAGRMTYIDLSSKPGYMNQYVGALFLPHTDLDLFPSVKKSRHVSGLTT
ncbi:MAG: DUF4445 domain-containing protein [Ignavibacteriae bacterium]|nr:DUF4445 domain-containing protein [Ignavibacteriota bacterium]